MRWSREYKKPTLEEYREKILGYVKNVDYRPVLIGQIATLMNRSCEEAEELLEQLVLEGALRRVGGEEARGHGILCGYSLIRR